jgi:hypothetical protein
MATVSVLGAGTAVAGRNSEPLFECRAEVRGAAKTPGESDIGNGPGILSLIEE